MSFMSDKYVGCLYIYKHPNIDGNIALVTGIIYIRQCINLETADPLILTKKPMNYMLSSDF